MSAVDRIAIGVTLIAFGVGAAIQDWPIPVGLIGAGLGTAGVGLWQLAGDLRDGAK